MHRDPLLSRASNLRGPGRRDWTSLVLIGLLAWSGADGGVAGAAEPLARLLPANTVFYFSTTDVKRLDNQWQKTSYAALKKNKQIDAFLDDVRLNKEDDWLTPHDRFGTEFDDLLTISAGDVAGAIVPLGDKYATVMLVDATGRQAQLAANLVKVDAHWAKLGGKRSITTRQNTSLIVFDLPPKSTKHRGEQRIYFQLGNIAVDTDRMEVVDSMILRYGGKASDGLDKHPPFTSIMDRATSVTDAPQPDVRWYMDPMATWKLVESLSAPEPQPLVQRSSTTRPAAIKRPLKKTSSRKSVDWRALVERQGGKSIQAAGGAVHFSVERFDFLHRTTVLAPPPLEKMMQMLTFTPGEKFQPPPWVAEMVTRYSTFYSVARPLYDGYAYLFNELNGEGDDQFLQEIMKSLKTDPEGPLVDIPGDVIDKLGPRLVAIRDERGAPDAAGNPSRRVLLAAVANDPKKTFDTIDRFYKGDPEFDRVEHNGRVLWASNIPGASLFGQNDDPAIPSFRTLSIVPEGYLFLATDVDLLKETLDSLAGRRTTLAESADYRFVESQLQRWSTAKTFAQHFSHTDEEARETYELLRQGKLAEGRTWDAQVLNSFLFGNTSPRRRKIDGSRLPNFDDLRKHFGPGGLTAELTADGWQLLGFVVKKSSAEK